MTDYVLPRKPEPSQEYVELLDTYKEMHKQQGLFKGISLIPFIHVIKDLIISNKCKTLFDYGCGNGLPYTKDFKHIKIYIATTSTKGTIGTCIKRREPNVKSINKSVTTS